MSATLTDVERNLTSYLCPTCFHGELEVALRCDLEWRGCLTALHCTRCGYWFEPDTERRALDRIEQRIASGDLDAACPECAGRRQRAEFRCDLASHRCCYFLHCLDCGEAHQLYA